MTVRAKKLMHWWAVLTLLSMVIGAFSVPSGEIYDPFCEDSCLFCVERQDTLIDRYFWCCIPDWTCWFQLDRTRNWYCPRRKYNCLADEDPTVPTPYPCYGPARTDACTQRGGCCDFGL